MKRGSPTQWIRAHCIFVLLGTISGFRVAVIHPFGARTIYDTDKYDLYQETVVIINPFGDGQIYDKTGCSGKSC